MNLLLQILFLKKKTKCPIISFHITQHSKHMIQEQKK